MDPIKELEREQLRTDVPQIAPGDTVKVSVKVVEGSRERIQIFEGTVMRLRGGGLNQRITVRRIAVGRRRGAHLHGPRAARREDRGRSPRGGPPGPALLPARPRREGSHAARAPTRPLSRCQPDLRRPATAGEAPPHPPRDAHMRHERELRMAGFRSIAGIDEVGRGSLAGPVVAAAVILPDRHRIKGLRDSKCCRVPARSALRADPRSCRRGGCRLHGGRGDRPHQHPPGDQARHARGIGHLGGPGPPGHRCAQPAGGGPSPAADHRRRRHLSLDRRGAIVAKVTRDRICDEFDARYPAYGFTRNKGYGTRCHSTP